MLGVSSLIQKSHLALPAMSAYHCLQLVFLYKESIGQANSRFRKKGMCVPHGSIPSQLLFILFIYDLPANCPEASFHILAVDAVR